MRINQKHITCNVGATHQANVMASLSLSETAYRSLNTGAAPHSGPKNNALHMPMRVYVSTTVQKLLDKRHKRAKHKSVTTCQRHDSDRLNARRRCAYNSDKAMYS